MEEEKEYQIEDAEAHSNDKKFMIDAIAHKASWVLAYQELRNDKEVVLEAVKNKWLIIKYASKSLRSDKDIAMEVLKQNKEARIYLTDEILKDKDIDLILNPPQEESA